jgi:glycosyltransferase involved in cell wall biosynthesis
MPLNQTLSSLSIFFPAYNDENTVEPLALKCVEVASALTDKFEVIIVNDASPDGTGRAADHVAAKHPDHIRVIHHPVNRGVGEAMKTGYREAAMDYVFYTDGDMQYDVAEIKLLVPYVKDYGVVAGYRLNRAEGFSRWFTSRCFHLLAFMMLGLRFRDIDCSFKLIRREVLQKISFSTGGGLVDAELLLRAKKLTPIREVGVHHYNRRFGHSQCLKPGLVFHMLCELVELRLRLWKNR